MVRPNPDTQHPRVAAQAMADSRRFSNRIIEESGVESDEV